MDLFLDPPAKITIHDDVNTGNDNITLECKVVDSNPLCAVVWEIDGHPIYGAVETNHSLLNDNTSRITFKHHVTSERKTVSCRPRCELFPSDLQASIALPCTYICYLWFATLYVIQY